MLTTTSGGDSNLARNLRKLLKTIHLSDKDTHTRSQSYDSSHDILVTLNNNTIRSDNIPSFEDMMSSFFMIVIIGIPRWQPSIGHYMPRWIVRTTPRITETSTHLLVEAPSNRYLPLRIIITAIINGRRRAAQVTPMVPNTLHSILNHNAGSGIICIPDPHTDSAVDAIVGASVLAGEVLPVLGGSVVGHLVQSFLEKACVLIIADEFFAVFPRPATEAVGDGGWSEEDEDQGGEQVLSHDRHIVLMEEVRCQSQMTRIDIVV